MLVTLSGRPATGKTSIARALARATRAVPVRIDLVEQAVVTVGLEQHPVGPVGYLVAYALTEDLLRQGFDVIADAVNPVAATRDHWRDLAGSVGVPLLEVEVVCSDQDLHRGRAQERVIDIPALPRVSWERIVGADYEPWSRPVLRIDTAVTGVAQAAELVQRHMR